MPALKLAVVGAGPSAFYTVARLLSSLPPTFDILVHIYDRLPAPHGLVRYGVAPDHPEVKNCIHKFDSVASDPRVRFLGNVLVSPSPSSLASYPCAVHLPLASLAQHYTHLLLTYGSSMPLPLRSLPNATSALALVHWYTGHPSSPASSPPLPLDAISHLSLIGHGNVSLDIARLLLRSPSSLATYSDLPRSVLTLLESSRINHVSIIGRRGPAQVSFTAKELRELMSLSDVAFEPIPLGLLSTPRASGELDRPKKRILDILAAGSKAPFGSTEKSWSLRFLRSPESWDPDSKHLTLGLNTLSATGQAEPTGEQEQVSTDAVVASVGYRSELLAGTEAWFDETTGRLRNAAGRVLDSLGRVVRHVYASGWVATGARGVIAASMHSAYQTADSILADLDETPPTESAEGPLRHDPKPGLPHEILAAAHDVYGYDDWRNRGKAA